MLDALIDSRWMGSSSPMDDVAIRLWKMRQTQSLVGINFVVDVLSLWLRAEGPVLGIKTAGKDCGVFIVLPVVKWWIGGREGDLTLIVKAKHIPPAEALVSKLEELSWTVSKDIQSASQLSGKPERNKMEPRVGQQVLAA